MTSGEASALIVGVTGDAVVRVAGLTTAVLDWIRSPRLTEALDDVLARRDGLSAQGRALADALHPVIGALPRDGVRPRVIGLRRALHAGRRPATREWTPEIAARLPSEVSSGIADWLAGTAALAAVEESLPQVLAAERECGLSALLKAATDPGFRIALGGTSPVLAAELEKWIADPGRTPRSGTTTTLARYPGPRRDQDQPPEHVRHQRPRAVAHRRPRRRDRSGRSLRRLRALLLPHPREHRRLRPGPRGRSGADRAQRLRPAPGGEQIVFLRGLGMLGLLGGERFCAIPARPSVLALIDVLGEEPGGLPRPVLRDRLTSGDTSLNDEVDAFVDHLLDAGLLVRGLPLTHPHEVLAGAATWTRPSTGLPDASAAVPPPALAAALGRAAAALGARPAADDADLYRARRETVVSRLRELAAFATPGSPHHAMFSSLTAVNVRDTAVAAEPPAACSVRTWQPVAGDLDVIRRWIAPFAPHLPARLALTELFGERLRERGPVPVLAFYREYQWAMTEMDEVGAELRGTVLAPSARHPEDSVLDGVRRLADVMATALAALTPYETGGTGALAVPVEALRAAIATYPAWVPEVRSISAYVQPAGGLGVVNALGTGFGSVRARLDHLTGRRDSGVRDPGTGPIHAEFGSRFGISLNDHRRCLPYQLGGTPQPARRRRRRRWR
ncbi:hypothetical protein [Nonomuraea salmonea]|uniref:hypothetical protein n=1 Tax=Nonomuraea salmonea TaxID=46181 RepID=UPI002FE9B501